MSVFGNFLWVVLGGGILIFFGYLIGGLLLCLTLVGIPFGVQCIKLSVLGLAPFGREIVRSDSSSGVLALLMNILWILVGGVWIAVVHVVFAVLCAITIIGLPFARQHMKLAALALVPFGASVQ